MSFWAEGEESRHVKSAKNPVTGKPQHETDPVTGKRHTEIRIIKNHHVNLIKRREFYV